MTFTDTFRFSASSLKTYLQCGQKFKYEKVERLKPNQERGHSRWMGKLVHASIYSSFGKFLPEDGFKAWKLEGKKITDKEEGIRRALETFESLWVRDESTDYKKSLYDAEVGGERPEGKFNRKKKEPNLNTEDQTELEENWKEEARQMVINGVKCTANLTEIVEIEREIKFSFNGKEFVGFVDVLGKNTEGEIIFLDMKTVWDRPYPKKMSEDPQFILYSVALKELLGLDYYPKGYFIHLRSGNPVEFEMTDEILESFSEKFDNAVIMIDRGMFYKKTTPLCNYCDFQDICQGAFVAP